MDETPFDPATHRGVENPKVIDLISYDGVANKVTLLMIENRSWNSTPQQITELEEKFNNYIDYVLDGWLVKQYPQYSGLPVFIKLECREEPDKRELMLFEVMAEFAERNGIGFSVSLISAVA